MPNHRSRISLSSSTLSALFQNVVPAGLLQSVAVGPLPSRAQSTCWELNLPSNTSVVTKQGMVCASTLSPGDRIVACGGSREISDVGFQTMVAPMFCIEPGVLNPSQPVTLRADQFIRITDARALSLFGIRTALLRVGDLNGLVGIAALGVMRHVSVTLRLAVADAVFVETLWLEAVNEANIDTDPRHLCRDESRLLLSTPLPPRGAF
ncbi:MAG: hypothetical protein JWS10_1054 [Cypionkella sp.]|nr:hypothetical protein [Cypionkella sp.]